MNSVAFEKYIDRLHAHKVAVGKLSMGKKKHLINSLLIQIEGALETIEQMETPTELEPSKTKLFAIIYQAQVAIEQEYTDMPHAPVAIETLTAGMNVQVNVIRDAFNKFEGAASLWLNS